MQFVQRCARAAGVDLADPRVVVDQRGMQNLVLLDLRRRVAWRFPRTSLGCRGLRDAASRLQVLGSHDLPVPRVLDLHLSHTPSQGHLVLTLVAGTPLDTVATDEMAPGARSRLAGSLIEAVDRIRAVPVAQWPTAEPAWSSIWDALVSAVRTCDDLPPDQRRHHLGLAVRAAEVARAAPIGIFHGDLGGVNCRIDPDTGDVAGLLDWDSAAVGDTATDIAAILAGLGPVTARELRAASDRWRAEEVRYRAYVDTWAVQSFLWSLRSGTPQDRSAARALLTARPPAGHR